MLDQLLLPSSIIRLLSCLIKKYILLKRWKTDSSPTCYDLYAAVTSSPPSDLKTQIFSAADVLKILNNASAISLLNP